MSRHFGIARLAIGHKSVEETRRGSPGFFVLESLRSHGRSGELEPTAQPGAGARSDGVGGGELRLEPCQGWLASSSRSRITFAMDGSIASEPKSPLCHGMSGLFDEVRNRSRSGHSHK
jgi:hypothetical protein